MLAICLQLGCSSSPSKGMVLRIRFADGSMEKVLVPQGAEETMTLSDVLDPFEIPENCSISVGNKKVVEKSPLLSGLGVKHGSLITIQQSSTKSNKPTESRFSQIKKENEVWKPFPDLAKSYEHALLKTKTKRSSQKGMSYGDIARLQSSLHVVDPQQDGPLKRVYMCRNAAERFQVNGLNQKSKTIHARVGLLLGTIQRERVEPKRARTSLSSQTLDSGFCTVAKVQAVWEPPGQNNKNTALYDKELAQNLQNTNDRVMAIAEHLGLVPVGWIFSHTDTRHEEEDALPVFGLDVETGAKLQIVSMKKAKNNKDDDGRKFVTLSMDANTGGTEAFQLSDVSVQMVHEGMLLTNSKENKRHVPTRHPLLIDGKETKDLDSVLCLINTAMLSHEGAYSGKSAASSVKKNGGLTTKTKKALLAILGDDTALLEYICDFNVLLALDQSLSKQDSEELCELVRKWARGQKQGTQITSNLKMHLRSVLET